MRSWIISFEFHHLSRQDYRMIRILRKVPTFNITPFIESQQGGGKCRVADLSAGHFASDFYVLEIGMIRKMVPRQVELPDLPALSGLGWAEVHHHVRAALEVIINVFAGIGSHNNYALVVLKPFEKIVVLQVGLTVIGRFHLSLFAQQGIDLIWEEDYFQSFRSGEDLM
jgi:hypothetical protein